MSITYYFGCANKQLGHFIDLMEIAKELGIERGLLNPNEKPELIFSTPEAAADFHEDLRQKLSKFQNERNNIQIHYAIHHTVS